MKWTVESLNSKHNRGDFDSGVESLNRYIRELATQHAKRNISKTFVAVEHNNPSVCGFYSLSTGSMLLEELPESARHRLPRYPIPTAHLGQLAIDLRMQGQGLGAALLFDALRRVTRVGEELGIYAITVDALDEKAKKFYERYGFVAIDADPFHLYLETKIVRQLL